MQNLEYTLAHGSSNLFVMIDAITQKIEVEKRDVFVREVCNKFKSDGLLFVEKTDKGAYAMNMYNTDGSQAEMCGNGMRIVARYCDQTYMNTNKFTLYSGGKRYPITRQESTEVVTNDGERVAIPNYGVDIAISRSSSEFTLADDEFIAQPIEELDESLLFTYLNLGNPHIVAEVEQIDLELLSRLGERVKELPHIFTRGVNVSLMKDMGRGEIFVATYERGVGLTPSCGTAMTASSTTATLLGICNWGEEIVVRNRGGFVKCICSESDEGDITTQLIGNATYIERGTITPDIDICVKRSFNNEVDAWSLLTEQNNQ